MRNRANRRRNTRMAIRRKAREISHAYYGEDWLNEMYHGQRHRLAKDMISNAITIKTRSKPSIADKKKIDSMNYEED